MVQIESSYYDVVFLIIIGISVLLGLLRGVINEILSLSVWIISFLLVLGCGKYVDHYIPNVITSGIIRNIIIFIVFFIIATIINIIVKKLCSKLISSIGLGGLNRLLGMFFGIGRGILFCAIIVVAVAAFNIDSQQSWRKAKTYIVIKPISTWMGDIVSNSVKNLSHT